MVMSICTVSCETSGCEQRIGSVALEGTGRSVVLSFSLVDDRDSIADHGLLGAMTRGSVIACLMMMV